MMKRLLDSIRVLVGRSRAVPVGKRQKDNKYYCPVCKEKVLKFVRLPDYYYKKQDEVGYIHSIYFAETINRLAYSCPHCGASDRERLYALYFERFFKLESNNFRLLDIAPARPLQKYLKSTFSEMVYRSADLMMEDVDDKVDITNMTIYKDGQFDFFICSHVLEHIEEDTQAMAELYRVLKSGGGGIAMVPILLNLKEDYENPDVVTEADRWKHYGQDDHVRFYSKPGFIQKLKSVGFNVHQYGINDFGSSIFNVNGIHHRSILYIVTK